MSLCSRKKISHAVISDINPDIYNLSLSVKDDPGCIIQEIENLEFSNMREDYCRPRRIFNSPSDPFRRSVLFMYLNRHCFNGVYKHAIQCFSRAMESCEVLDLDFEEEVRGAKEGHPVYSDPPYIPLSST